MNPIHDSNIITVSAETFSTPPPVLSLRLLRLLHRCCPDIATSLGLLIGWTEEEIAARNALAAQTRAIDDPLEVLDGEIRAALESAPVKRRRRIQAAIAEVHARTEAAATRLAISPDA